ncbi:hypothetical protein [Falsiroseomonas sp. HW251]|uniref:hypothetical protein n=1 Tax=Falsiroseomonas sp. HW251 TaxID=3390998 RepID=UPI003D31F729
MVYPDDADRLQLARDADGQGVLDEIADAARRLAGRQLKRRLEPMDAALRHRFDMLVLDAEDHLRGIPVAPPRQEKLRASWKTGVARARRLSNRPSSWRKELLTLAVEMEELPADEWTLERALQVEAAPAILAFGFLGRGFRVVRAGVAPPQQVLVHALRRHADQLVGAPGRPHAVDGNFDVAVLLLLRAFGLVTGETGLKLLAHGLSVPADAEAASVQVDAGPRVEFVRAAVAALAPDVAELMGGQAIGSAVRRLRRLDTNENRAASRQHRR